MSDTADWVNIAIDRQELERFANSHIGFIGLDLTRISLTLLGQIFILHHSRTVNTFQILDELKFLEGLRKSTNTQKADKFNHPPLIVLRKKHFMSAIFIPHNIFAHFGITNGGNPRLDEIVKEAFKTNTSGYADAEFFNTLAHNFTVGAYEERAKRKRLSGEWIVFQEYAGKNYYLTLGSHTEGDDAIYDRVIDCYKNDFRFLQGAR